LLPHVADLEARRPRQLAIEGEAPGQRARLLVVGFVDGRAAEDDVAPAEALQVALRRAAAPAELPDAVREVEIPAGVAGRIGYR